MNPAPLSLAAWLQRIEDAHPGGIVLGLERADEVGRRLAVLNPPVPVITVAGTNGKGTVVGVLEAVLNTAGYRVGAYTSPHLLRFNERIRVGGAELGDEALIAAFERVERARGDTLLTYFEFTTLAALDAFTSAECDVWVLEVGLGGRLDAVNTVDPDAAVVTRIALDHTEYLGPDIDAVAREKAGIFRRGRPAVVGQIDPPDALLVAARECGADLRRAGVDFRGEPAHKDSPAPVARERGGDPSATPSARLRGGAWNWRGRSREFIGLPAPDGAAGGWQANAAAALAALEALRDRLPVDEEAVRAGVAAPPPPGRLQRIVRGGLEWVLDVAHNADAADELARWLDGTKSDARRRAVFAVAARKDVVAILAAIGGRVDEWYLPELEAPGMYPAADLALQIEDHGGRVAAVGKVEEILPLLDSGAGTGDQVVVFGSFFTVAAVQTYLGGR